MKKVYLSRFLLITALLSITSLIVVSCTPGEQPTQPTQPTEPAQQTVSAQDAQQIAYDATMYGFPLVIMDITRQVFTAVPVPMDNGAPVNQFGNKKTIPDATFTTVVRPNADTLYSAAWVDTSEEPFILSAPDTGGHYYMLPMMNYWTDVFESLGSRTTGNGAGNFAITGPNWSGELPEGVTEIKSPGRWVWVIGRIACAGPADYDNVHKIQDGLKLTPLSAWGTDYTPPTNVPVDPNVNRSISPLNQLLAMDAPAFFNDACRLMVESPPYDADAPTLNKITGIGIKPGADYQAYYAGLDDDIKSAIQAGYQSALKDMPETKLGEIKNDWQMVYGTADFGTNYVFRAAVDYQGLGANLNADAVYFTTFIDGNGNKFSSDKKYKLHFDKDGIPPVNGFWSLTMYNDKMAFADNPINRYSLGSLSDPPLVTNPDGSIDIYIQRDSPDSESNPNWLPAPASGDFSVALRLYWPQEPAVDKVWVPPAIQIVE
jgi:hypothetical protein